jgi:hypothetical protein
MIPAGYLGRANNFSFYFRGNPVLFGTHLNNQSWENDAFQTFTATSLQINPVIFAFKVVEKK